MSRRRRVLPRPGFATWTVRMTGGAPPAAAPASVQVHRRIGHPAQLYLALVTGLTALYVVTASYARQSIDTIATYYPAWQLAEHRNVTMTAFAGLDPWFVPVDGRLVSNRFPGASWLAAPFYAVLGTSHPTALPANLVAAISTALAMAVLLALLREITTATTALVSTLLVALATPTWTVSADALWTHGPAQLWILTGTLLFVRGRHLTAGFAYGAAITTRVHLAVVPAVICAWDAFTYRRARPLLATAVGSAAGLGLLLAYDRHVFGSYDPRGGYLLGESHPAGLDVIELSTRVAATLVSPLRGVLVLTPFVLLLLPGLPAAWRTAPVWVRSAAAAGTAYMLVQLCADDWTGGIDFFSYRLALEWTTLATPLLVLSFDAWTRRTLTRRRVFAALCLMSLTCHAVGAVLYVPLRPQYETTWSVGQLVGQRPLASALVCLVCVAAAAVVVCATGLGATLKRPVRSGPDVRSTPPAS